MRVLHVPVLLKEVMDALNPGPDKNYIDVTLGYGGHAKAILDKTAPNGRLIGIDQDEDALVVAKETMAPYVNRFQAIHGSFGKLDELVSDFEVNGGILADIGVSSVQLDNPERGFSFRTDGPLDMRMDRTSSLTAAEIVNTWDEAQISKIIREYGEERFSKRIARAIVDTRQVEHIETTKKLEMIVLGAIPRRFWPKGINPATRTFQAIRIAVNNELGALTDFLPQAVDLLNPGARLAVITFHSLEDRIVKDYFKERVNPCTCPSEFPKCVCGKIGDVKIITKKPIIASEEEIKINPRSRSAKLRVIEKIK